ncbi:MAG: succinylglutamate desuccinylase/aspartoacylase family protein [Acidimicrobiia bacterium]|nr:succinylglutamate desuccinylase/aspartoacylase family protein [Acidimicrobiia bacterium]
MRPGRRARIDLNVARLPTGTWLSLPVTVLHGTRPGPTLGLTAALHGNEINGIEIIRRVLEDTEPRSLAGTVVAVPIVNVFGFLNESRYLPDRRDLNRAFPGSPRGSMAARLAHLVMTEVIGRCSHAIDLHTGAAGRMNHPQIRADLTAPETLRCAEAFAAPLLIHAGTRDGSLREAARERGIPMLLYEGGEAQRFDEKPIRLGTEGVRRLMSHLGMLDAPLPPAIPPVTVRSTRWVRAGRAGIFLSEVELGTHVERGAGLGRIVDAFGESALRVRTPVPGVVIGHSLDPVVHRGDALVHVGVTADDGSRTERQGR